MPRSRRICAVIPAAGRGSRLGSECPKILAPVGENRTIWKVLRGILLPHVDHIHVVLSPVAEPVFQRALAGDPELHRISTGIQSTPLGMGDAIFGARGAWSDFENLVIVWGDQVNLSPRTIKSVTRELTDSQSLILPLVRMKSPYVQYDFDGSRLLQVRQVREGDVTDPEGASDVGLFGLSIDGLEAHWEDFLKRSIQGASTGEINFLPFLPFLSSECGWRVRTVAVDDDAEARGVNTPEDLTFAKARLASRCP